ncbi:MAG: hypothetical protein KC776_00440 [Myxococcales bacterium]|nr:hypothetical protein [Myxococcales bacterium]MCB9582060.1 hypothetical protein [Polyangiaceae bacterium]
MKLRLSALALCAALVGCGGPQFDGHVFRNEDMAFRVGPIPQAWRPIQVSGSLLAYRDDRDHATIALNGRCGKDGDDVPLEALTHHLFLQFTDREVKSQEVLSMDGRDAMRTEMVAELDGVPKYFTVFVLKKDGCVYDFLHIAESSGPVSGQAEFERFVNGFATLS